MKRLCAIILIAVYVSNGSLIREQFQCIPGVPYRENECNECHCIKLDDLVCTLSRCEENENKGLENCPTGVSWYKDNGCNKCWCVNIGTMCTNYVNCSESYQRTP